MAYLKSALTAIVFTAVAVGFAFAMPAIVTTAARVPTEPEPVVAASVLPTHTPTATVPPEDADDDGEHPENHGAAVSTAAHCPIKGKAHGELVRSIAKDKGATVADVEAACEAALAAAAAEPAKAKGKPDKAERVKPAQPPKPPKPSKPAKPLQETGVEETETDDVEVEVDDADTGPGHGKGHAKP